MRTERETWSPAAPSITYCPGMKMSTWTGAA